MSAGLMLGLGTGAAPRILGRCVVGQIDKERMKELNRFEKQQRLLKSTAEINQNSTHTVKQHNLGKKKKRSTSTNMKDKHASDKPKQTNFEKENKSERQTRFRQTHASPPPTHPPSQVQGG